MHWPPSVVSLSPRVGGLQHNWLHPCANEWVGGSNLKEWVETVDMKLILQDSTAGRGKMQQHTATNQKIGRDNSGSSSNKK
jgi:hypothetical protein